MRARPTPRCAVVTSLVAAVVATASGVAIAGGNLQFRNPTNPSEVFDQLRDPRRPMTWVMSEDGLPGSGISNATLVSALTAAFDAWESIPTSDVSFHFGGEVPVRLSGLGGPLGAGIDGRNLVTFTDPNVVFPSGGELAVAITFSFPTATVVDASNHDLDGDGIQDLPDGTYPPGTIFDADIVFNSSDHLSVSGANGTQDIQAIAMHEVGHTLGLSHSMIRDAVMWPFLASNIAAARTLKPDDVAYGSFFYPAQPAYGATFGAVRGRITNGATGV